MDYFPTRFRHSYFGSPYYYGSRIDIASNRGDDSEPSQLIRGGYIGTIAATDKITPAIAKPIFKCPSDSTAFGAAETTNYIHSSYYYIRLSAAEAEADNNHNGCASKTTLTDANGKGIGHDLATSNPNAIVVHDFLGGFKGYLLGLGYSANHENTINTLRLGGHVQQIQMNETEQKKSWNQLGFAITYENN